MEQWQKTGQNLSKSTGVVLKKFDIIPDDLIEDFCILWTEVDSQQPLGELDSRDIATPEIRREYEKHYAEMGYKMLTLLSQEEDGTLSGITEVRQHNTNKMQIIQDLTGVKDQYRGRGLGKWLKAEMAFLIQEKFPEAKYIHTGNASENDAMLSINHRMGFKEHRRTSEYKFSVEKLQKLLLKKL